MSDKSEAFNRVKVSGLSLPLNHGEEELSAALYARLGPLAKNLARWTILRKALDARGAKPPGWVYTLGVEFAEGVIASGFPEWAGGEFQSRLVTVPLERPVIVGAGPAGLFAALRLSAHGLKPLILERGKPIEERGRDIKAYWKTGMPDPESNIQFGEGGAGAFSDGKLTSRSKDYRKDWVLSTLVRAGADKAIAYEAKPHLGTDRLRSIVKNLRNLLLDAGCEIRFGERVMDLLVEGGTVRGVKTTKGEYTGSPVFLGTGHSARDVYALLHEKGAVLKAKGFAVGLRVELSQEALDRDRFKSHAGMKELGRAEFFLARSAADARGVYSFCMCPGGVVIPSASAEGELVINGMSGSKRSSRIANAALVVEVRPSDFGEGPLMGLEFQRTIESRAFSSAGVRAVPATTVKGFLAGKGDPPHPSNCPWPLKPVELGALLPGFAAKALRETLPSMINEIKPLAEGNLLGVETRTSSPVRIERGEDLQSFGIRGLYPIGEGAGYAGGIVSSAIDGAKSADAYLSLLGA